MNRRDVLLSGTLLVTGFGCFPIVSSANGQGGDERNQATRNINGAVARYVASWNEQDPDRRRAGFRPRTPVRAD